MIKLACIMGTTCSGKSTFLNYAEKEHSNLIGTINVGQMLRDKYPPEHFAGSAAPEHTEVEAWKMFSDALKRHLDNSKQLVLADGQPRSYNQVQWAIELITNVDFPIEFILFDCRKEIRRTRLVERFANDSESLNLGLERLTNDMILYYTVLAELTHAGVEVEVIKTDGKFETYGPQLLERLLDV